MQKFLPLSLKIPVALLSLIFLLADPTPVRGYPPGNDAPVEFSHSPGFYSSSFLLELSHPDPAAVIHYSLDGSNPGASSPIYSQPILVDDRSGYENRLSVIPTSDKWVPPGGKVAKAFIIKAVAYNNGTPVSGVRAATWFVFPEGEKKYSLAVISIITEEDCFFCDSAGIYVNRNYRNSGREWEREISLEVFSPDVNLQQNAGVRIHGGNNGRELSQKSLRLYARSEYGENRFRCRIFPDIEYSEYNRLVLRNGGNDWTSTLFRDAAIQSIVSHLNFDTQAYRPAIVFLNGEYWGIHNIRERYDRHYLARVYGVDPGDLDLLTFDPHETSEAVIREGDADHYNAMIEYLRSNDMEDPANYDHIRTLIDIDNFIDYHIAGIFAANVDWPGNNNDFWRLRSGSPGQGGRNGHDGRWRWLLYDTDVGFGYVRNNFVHNTLAQATEEGKTGWPNPDQATFVLRTLLGNDEFRLNFINRFSDLLNTTFLPERTTAVIDGIKSVLEPEISEHIQRWNSPVSFETWESNTGEMTRFARERPYYQRSHLREYFNLGEDVSITVSVDDPGHGHIRVNTADIVSSTPGVTEEPYPWTGVYFQGVPVRIEALPARGYRFSHWSGDITDDKSILTITPGEDVDIKASFVKIEELPVISYWFFGTDLPNDTPLESIEPVYSRHENSLLTYISALDGYPFNKEHENWRKASLERRNSPTAINYLPGLNDNLPIEESGMRGIQVRQPMASGNRENTIIFHLPTTGFEHVEFRFAAMDEGAAGNLVIDYSVSSGEPVWTVDGLDNVTPVLLDSYQYYLLDFSSIGEANNNAYFRIRIRFDGPEMFADAGNRVTFNNFSLHGDPLTSTVPGPVRITDEIRMYPVPATGILNIEFGNPVHGPAHISIICTKGMTILEKTVYPLEETVATLNIEGILPGIYLVNIRQGESALSRRIVIF
jgi:hypothetical protein